MTRTATITWHSTGGDPPDHVWVKVSATSHWDGYVYPTGTRSGSADNGLGDPMVPGANCGDSIGTHLIWMDSSSGTLSVPVTFTQSMTASGTQTTDGELDYALTVSVDDRGIALTRDGAHDETREPDGTGHGDTTYSYDRVSEGQEGPPVVDHMVNWQYFHPSFEGSWTTKWDQLLGDIPDVTWAWNPDCTGDTEFDGPWSMLYGTRYQHTYYMGDTLWEGDLDSPAERTITYTATDHVDGAQCTARYVLTMHDPIEPDASSDVETHHHLDRRPAPNYIWLSCPASAPEPRVGSLTVSAGDSWSRSVGISGQVAEWACLKLNINYSEQYTFSTSTSTTINNVVVPQGYQTRLMIYEDFVFHDGVANEYDVGGYSRQEAHEVQVPDHLGTDVDDLTPFVE